MADGQTDVLAIATAKGSHCGSGADPVWRAEQPIVIEWVQYYDSTGKRIRDYLAQPSELRPLASVEFVIQRSDATGGPGANFLIRWKGPATVDEPLIEAVMVGQSGNAGISVASVGRVLKSS